MKHLVFATAIALSGTSAFAQLTVGDPWVRATVEQQHATGVFMRLTATEEIRIVEVRSPAATVLEIHEMKMEGNIMRMRPLPALGLAAGSTVELKPGGFHIMLTNLKRQIKVGDVVPLTLVIETRDKKRTAIEVKAPVRALNSTPVGNHSGNHSKH